MPVATLTDAELDAVMDDWLSGIVELEEIGGADHIRSQLLALERKGQLTVEVRPTEIVYQVGNHPARSIRRPKVS